MCVTPIRRGYGTHDLCCPTTRPAPPRSLQHTLVPATRAISSPVQHSSLFPLPFAILIHSSQSCSLNPVHIYGTHSPVFPFPIQQSLVSFNSMQHNNAQPRYFLTHATQPSFHGFVNTYMKHTTRFPLSRSSQPRLSVPGATHSPVFCIMQHSPVSSDP